MIELLWLLLPVAAFSGWVAAKRSIDRCEPRQDERAPIYFRGLNFLLNEQPDKAIDLFVQMLEVDSETVETHLALGNLFRRRGEVDRAIRIHQNLIARPSLTRDQRGQALLELGQDYMRAGLYDRAESLFNELGELNLYQVPALENLHVIYQQEKDWEKCLTVAKKLQMLTQKSYAKERAHYYCELAEQAHKRRDMKQAGILLRKAQSIDADCVRASLMQAEMAATMGSCKNAVAAYKKVAKQDPAFIGEMLPSMIACYQQGGNQLELVRYLRDLTGKHPNIASVLALVGLIKADQGDQVARQFLTDYLQRHPDLLGVEYLISLDLHKVTGAAQESLQFLKDIIGKILENRPAYQCSSCGFGAKSLHWQCPGCKSWSSIKPVTGLREDIR